MADRTSTVRVNVVTDSSGGISGLSKFSRLAGVAALGIAGLAIGGALATTKLYAFGDAVDDANTSIATGLKTMGLFGKQTDEVTARVIAQGEALSKQTGIDQTVIKTTQAKLLTFKELAKTADEQGGAFDRATQAAVDLAAKGFGTAETNAVQLGKALNDPVKGLTSLGRAGITFTAQEQARIKTLVESNKLGQAQALVLKAIESQVGGTAAATAGGFELMQNRVKLFGQELALKALPYLDRFGNFMINTGGPAIARFSKAVGEEAVPKLRQLSAFVQKNVVPVLQDLGGFIINHLVPAYSKVLAGALEGARGFFHNVAKSVGENGPQLQDMADKAKRLGTFLVDKVLPVLGQFYKVYLPKLGTALGVAIGYISASWQALNKMYDAAVAVVNAIQSVIDKLKDLANAPKAGLSHIPGVGGLFGRIAGDGGIPVGGISPFSHVPSGRTTINFNGLVTDPRAAARQVETVLRRNQLASGVVVVG